MSDGNARPSRTGCTAALVLARYIALRSGRLYLNQNIFRLELIFDALSVSFPRLRLSRQSFEMNADFVADDVFPTPSKLDFSTDLPVVSRLDRRTSSISTKSAKICSSVVYCFTKIASIAASGLNPSTTCFFVSSTDNFSALHNPTLS